MGEQDQGWGDSQTRVLSHKPTQERGLRTAQGQRVLSQDISRQRGVLSWPCTPWKSLSWLPRLGHAHPVPRSPCDLKTAIPTPPSPQFFTYSKNVLWKQQHICHWSTSLFNCGSSAGSEWTITHGVAQPISAPRLAFPQRPANSLTGNTKKHTEFILVWGNLNLPQTPWSRWLSSSPLHSILFSLRKEETTHEQSIAITVSHFPSQVFCHIPSS